MTRRDPAFRITVAALLSLGLHALLVAGEWLRPPELKRESSLPLEARLVSPPPPASPRPAARPALPRREVSRARTSQRAPRRVAAPPVATTPAPAAHEVPEPSEAVAEAPPADASGTQSPAPPAAAESATLAASDAVPSVATLPRKGRIRYTAYLGEDRFTVGKTVQTWEVEGGEYRLGSVSETTGIVELFRAQRHVYLSEGRLTAHGLRPDRFFMSRTRRGRTEAARALFDWEAGRITLGKVPDQHGEALVPGAQDVVSFMYQLALAPPPPGRTTLPITNGSRFQIYEIDVLEEERIETPLGVLRTLPIRQVPRPGDESIEVWLAVDHLHLPVKIRFFDREGRPVGEQLVEQIEFAEE